MAKSDKKSTEVSVGPKKRQNRTDSHAKSREYVQNLLKLHKLQGVLLDKLAAEM